MDIFIITINYVSVVLCVYLYVMCIVVLHLQLVHWLNIIMNIHISRRIGSNTIFLFEMEVVLYLEITTSLMECTMSAITMELGNSEEFVPHLETLHW